MSWIPLSHRLNQLPLILAGPILRRTEPDAVTVWVALREPSEVTLKVYATKDGHGSVIQQLMLEGVRSTIPLGKHLHIVAVTAKSVNDNCLESGQIYAYDLNFNNSDRQNLLQALQTFPTLDGDQGLQQLNSEFSPQVIISYFDHQLPTFVLPPEDLNKLQIVHGSCRKPHGDGQDALPILDDLIEQNAGLPDYRPHQLFFTGDQIYGDDVADPLLLALTDAGDTLLGWEEHLPIVQQPLTTSNTYLKPKQLEPGQRSKVAETHGGFTAGLRNKQELAKSHLFSLGEYCATYLFFWSQQLWPERFPRGKDIYGKSKQARLWDKEVRALQGFVQTLWKVRRALANVPTYMIFDDHDISDDWYLNQAWCLRVLSKPLGRRVVQNGMLAYAVFQAWGNTPDQFQDGQSGEKLLREAKNWSASAGADLAAELAIARYLGIPDSDPLTGLPKMRLDGELLVLDRDRQTLKWHYTIRSSCHEVIVLDTRTWRGYPSKQAATTAPPMLLSPTAFDEQIREPLKQTDDGLAAPFVAQTENDDQLKKVGKSSIVATIAIAPTNLVSLQAIDWIQQWNLKQRQVFHNDVGDAWNINKGALAELLTALFERRDQVVVLSGDIHYGSAVRLNYWSCYYCDSSKLGLEDFEKPHVLAQLTSSAFKNEDLKTRLIHTKAKSILPERSHNWVGWNEPPQLLEIPAIPGRNLIAKFPIPGQGRERRQLQKSRADQEQETTAASLGTAWEVATSNRQSPPDWRCRIEWIKRQPARTIPWAQEVSWLKFANRSQNRGLNRLINVVKLLWRNRWLQEGEEVVGLNNFGLVRFSWSEQTAHRAVIQDLYWYPPWKHASIVSSRFHVPLELKDRL